MAAKNQPKKISSKPVEKDLAVPETSSETVEILEPDSDDLAADFYSALASADADFVEPQPKEEVSYEVEMPCGTVFKLNRASKNLVDYVSAAALSHSVNPLKVCARLIAKEQREDFESWYNDQLEKVYEDLDDWDNSDQDTPEPPSIGEWIENFVNSITDTILEIEKSLNPKD